MKTVVSIFALALSCFYSGHSSAQTKTAAPELTRYTEYSYMKVKPEMREDYIKLEKAWKKIHASRKKAGKLDDWSLLEVISPNGSKSEYNFVTRNAYRGKTVMLPLLTTTYPKIGSHC